MRRLMDGEPPPHQNTRARPPEHVATRARPPRARCDLTPSPPTPPPPPPPLLHIQKLYRWKALVKANSLGYMAVPNKGVQ